MKQIQINNINKKGEKMKNLKLEKIIVFLNLILGVLQLGDIVNKFAKERKTKKQESVAIANDQV